MQSHARHWAGWGPWDGVGGWTEQSGRDKGVPGGEWRLEELQNTPQGWAPQAERKNCLHIDYCIRRAIALELDCCVVRLWIMDGVCEVERNSNRKNVDKEHRDGEKGIWG